MGDIQHRYCGRCQRFHEDMFYRTMFHVVTVSPLTIYSVGLEVDENDNFDDVEPFTVVSHPPMPEDTEEGDICCAYMNINLMNHDHRDVVFQDGKPIDRLFRKDDPIPTWEELASD